jgi:hypothetical protein
MALFSNIRTVDVSEGGSDRGDDDLHYRAQTPYFRDCLQVKLDRPELSISEIYHGIFSHMPRWIMRLMQIRNALVGILGFATAKSNQTKALNLLKQGDDLGFIKVKEISEDHLIGFSEDKHMAFYLLLSKKEGGVEVSTLVNKKTWIGRIYVNAILPFHWLIARTAINQALKEKRL